MTRKAFLFFVIITLPGCAELQQVVNQLPNANTITNTEIASGLKQALNLGIDKQVKKLTQKDGFYKNELVKILLPETLRKVDKTLRNIGLSNLTNEGLKIINRAAEDAVKEAIPVFINAVKGIDFGDAKAILLGNDAAATQFLTTKTQTKLYDKFKPIITQSLGKVGADKIWNNLINKYNNLPTTKTINPDLTDYVTRKALQGVYTMIAIEEKEIRTRYASRNTALLKAVFALQD